MVFRERLLNEGKFMLKTILEREQELKGLSVMFAIHQIACPCREETRKTIKKNIKSKMETEYGMKTIAAAFMAQNSLSKLED